MKNKKWFWRGMTTLNESKPGAYHDFVRSYAACAAFADHQIGKILDALDHSPRRDRTIIVLWTDHGFHLGEKDHIEKFALWEKSNHVPYVIVAPGVTTAGYRSDQPVDLMSIYPTLLELCGLPEDDACDGESIVPLLRDVRHTGMPPALMTYMQGNHSVRSERWRYIRYADGTEELYDHDADPHEWTNLAARPEHAKVIRTHRKWLPKSEAEQVADLKAK